MRRANEQGCVPVVLTPMDGILLFAGRFFGDPSSQAGSSLAQRGVSCTAGEVNRVKRHVLLLSFEAE